jgi:hypothetical protein
MRIRADSRHCAYGESRHFGRGGDRQDRAASWYLLTTTNGRAILFASYI